MKIGYAAAMLAASVLCAGCQYSPDMLDRTIAYNRAVADSTNQVLLLNIVRASQRLPTYYTRLEGDASSMALTPNGSLSLPITNPKSLETDLNTSPTGALTSGTTKAISSLASIATTLGLQASESNLLTLQTLDDQKYQNGMMTPVPVKNIEAFQDEGYQRDLLFMMYLSSIAVSERLIDPIDTAVTTRCGALAPAPGDVSSGGSFIHQLCAYIDSRPYQGLFPAASAFSLRTCENSGGAVRDPAPKDMVHFNNDPAREGRKSSSADPHPEVCFQILLDDLLVLGLEVGSAEDIPAEVVDVVPDAVAQNPQFRGQMIQQNFFFRETSTGVSAICKKKSADNGFTLAFANAQAPGRATPESLTQLLDLLGAGAARTPRTPPPPAPPPEQAKKGAAAVPPLPSPNAAYPADPVSACQQKNPGVPESAADAVLASPTDAQGDAQSDAKGSGTIKPVKLTSDKMTFSTRSFQGMIYYLGEAVRYEGTGEADPVSFPRVLGRNPAVAGNGYFELLFYSSTQVPDSDTAVSVHDDDGTTYAIPRTCMSGPFAQASRPVGCSAEYPDNESLDVLNFVNQVWGLQKESVSAPTSPLVVVSPQ